MKAAKLFSSDPRLRPTKNKMGFASEELTELQQKFINHCLNSHLPGLDIGTCYGAVPKEISRNGKLVYANDIDKRHLTTMKKELTKKQQKLVVPVLGRFPQDLKFQKEVLGGVLASRIIHFLTGAEIKKALKNVHQWLAPEGMIFIDLVSPYTRFTIEKYEKRSKQGLKWPGYITFSQADKDHFDGNVPSKIHVLSASQLESLLKEIGFEMVQFKYYSPEPLPKTAFLDGREQLWVIAKKRS